VTITAVHEASGNTFVAVTDDRATFGGQCESAVTGSFPK
jgi:hypothetical protein